jgi:2-phospho-L-lactate guanylyltransferase
LDNIEKENYIWVILPVKPLSQAKTRLAKALSQIERQVLAERLLQHSLNVLDLARTQKLINGFVVVSRDDKVLALAEKHHSVPLFENQPANLNTALTQAGQWLHQHYPECSLLILPTDLPLLTVQDLETIIKQSQSFEQGAIIVPDRYQAGTNLLLLKPGTLLNFQYHFGDKSYSKHLEALYQTGIEPHVVQNTNLAFDLDEVEDLIKLDKALL